MPNASHDRIILRPELREISRLSDSSIDRREKEGLLPKRVQLGPRRVGWWYSEVMAALRALPTGMLPAAPTGAASKSNSTRGENNPLEAA